MWMLVQRENFDSEQEYLQELFLKLYDRLKSFRVRAEHDLPWCKDDQQSIELFMRHYSVNL